MVTMGLALAGAARVGAIGVVIDLLNALGLARLMTSLLYEVQLTDPAIFTSGALKSHFKVSEPPRLFLALIVGSLDRIDCEADLFGARR